MKLFGSKSHRPAPSGGSVYTAGEKKDDTGKTAYASKDSAASERTAEKSVAAHKKKKLRTGLTAAAVILAVLLALFAAYKIWVKPPSVDPNGPSTPNIHVTPSAEPTASAEPYQDETDNPNETDQPEETEKPETITRRDGTYTVLVVARDQASGNTDTMMVGMLDTERKEINVISIPRDTLVNKLWDTPKINAAMNYTGNVEGLMDSISELIGFKPDNYAVVNIAAFVQIVDAIGGVYYDVPYYMDYDDPTQNLSIHFEKGPQWLSGSDAIKVVRWRQNNDGTNYGDIARIENQQKFLSTIAKQVISLKNIPNIGTIINICTESLDTSLSANNIMWYAERLLELEADKVNFYTVPGNYNDYINSSGGTKSVVTINVDEWLDMINRYINPFDQDITETNVDIVSKDANGRLYSTTGAVAVR